MADEFERFVFVVSDSCLQSGCAKRLGVAHYPDENLRPNALSLPLGTNRQIKTISPGPEFPQGGVCHSLIVLGFNRDVTR
jgi:hypothetical protein